MTTTTLTPMENMAANASVVRSWRKVGEIPLMAAHACPPPLDTSTAVAGLVSIYILGDFFLSSFASLGTHCCWI